MLSRMAGEERAETEDEQKYTFSTEKRNPERAPLFCAETLKMTGKKLRKNS